MATNNFMFIEDMKPGEATQPAVSRPPAELDGDEAEPNPLPQRKVKPDADAIRAVRAVIAEPIGRLARLEATALWRAAGKTTERFDLLAAQHLNDSAARLCSALTPHVEAANAILGLSLTPDAIARDIAAEALAELREVWTVHSPEEIPGRVEPILARWETERGPSVAACLIVDPQIGAGS